MSFPPQPPQPSPMGAPAQTATPAPPPAAPLTDPTVQVDLSTEQLAQWWEQIEQARSQRDRAMTWADANLKAYSPALNDDPDGYGTDINTNRDFTLVERKKADLFYQRPDLYAKASPLFTDREDLLKIHANILNEKLGPNGVDAENLAEQVLFDVLCTTGMGWTVMGYESATMPVAPTPPAQVPGAILGLSQPPPAPAPVPLYEDCFWKWFSPKCALIPLGVRTATGDDWPWIGMEFEIDPKTALRKGWIADEKDTTSVDPKLRFDHGTGSVDQSGVLRGVLIYYKSALYRDDRVHPLHQTRLILIDGKKDKAADHVDSPFQTLDAQGRLTPDSLTGYPIHPATIRVLSDSAYVPSDCTISRPLINELNVFREQMVQMRDANIARFQYNTDVLPPDALQKIVRSPIAGMIGVPGEAFVGEGAIKELPHGTYPRENFQFNDFIDNDLARTHAIDANQSGAASAREQSATESAIKQNNVNARLSRERNKFLAWYLSGATKYSQIMQRLLPVEDAAQIVGQQAAHLLLRDHGLHDQSRGADQIHLGLPCSAKCDRLSRLHQGIGVRIDGRRRARARLKEPRQS